MAGKVHSVPSDHALIKRFINDSTLYTCPIKPDCLCWEFQLMSKSNTSYMYDRTPFLLTAVLTYCFERLPVHVTVIQITHVTHSAPVTHYRVTNPTTPRSAVGLSLPRSRGFHKQIGSRSKVSPSFSDRKKKKSWSAKSPFRCFTYA